MAHRSNNKGVFDSGFSTSAAASTSITTSTSTAFSTMNKLDMDGENVGSGTYALVFGCRDPRWVVKWGHDDPIALSAIAREKEVFEHLGRHDGIVKYYPTPDIDKILLERHDSDLEKYLKTDAPVPLMQWALEITNALAFLHSKDVVHRDLRPPNVLVSRGRVVLCDFGISSSTLLGNGQLGKTVSRFRDWRDAIKAGPQEDIFSMGSLLYTLERKQPPYAELKEEEVIQRYQNGEFPEVDNLLMGSIIRRCWNEGYEDVSQLR